MSALAELKQFLGDGSWLEGSDAAPYEEDASGRYRAPALLVLRPANTAQVAGCVKICRRHGVPLIAQGGNTGLCGGAMVLQETPSVLLSLGRMNRILSVAPERYTVTAEAGCILQTIHDAAATLDRSFALDWGARGTATVGGAISTNAGGINVLRYGPTREQVLGLEVVLPEGEVWDGLRSLRKDTSGYDLKHLFIGAEGTLGIVTKAVLKLHPRPLHDQSLWGAVADIDRLSELFVLARDMAGAHLSAFELIQGELLEMALARHPQRIRPLDTRSDWYVLTRFSGREPVEEQLVAFYDRAQAAGLLLDAGLAQSAAQEANLWHLRDEIPPGSLLRGQKMLKWDAAVPIDRIIPCLRAIRTRVQQRHPGVRLFAFGHVGDGNLHLSAFAPEDGRDADFMALAPQIERLVDETIWQFEGTICAEHGVGVLNIGRMVDQKTPIELALMARLRNLLDPETLLNPGKAVNPSWTARRGDGAAG
jgi:FAD/FMN-containing dehydrogenase